jgi:hypothetical protein
MTRYMLQGLLPVRGKVVHPPPQAPPVERELLHRLSTIQLEPNPLETLRKHIPITYPTTAVSISCIHDTLKPLYCFQASIQCPCPLYREFRRAPSCITRVINSCQDA